MLVSPLFLATILIFASSLNLSSQQQQTTPTIQRDAQAATLLHQAITATGTSLPADSTATGSVTITAGGETCQGSIRVLTRGTNQTSIQLQSTMANWSVIFSNGQASKVDAIDLCIKNAIIGVQEQNTYAQTERELRPTRRSAQASPGAAGFRLLSQRSGTAHWLQSKFGDALARYSTEGRSQGIVRTIFPRTTTEAGSAASTALGQPSSARADDARLSNESLDHRPHCGIDPESVRNPVPPRSRRTLDA